MKSKLVIGLVFLAPVLAFVLQNEQIVDMQLFYWHFAASLPLTVLSAVLVGVIIGMLAAPSRKMRKSRLEKRSQKEQKKQEQKPKVPVEAVSQEPVTAETSAVVQPLADEEFPPQS